MVNSRWMTQEEFDAVKKTLSNKTPINQSTCEITGEMFYALVVGRFRKLSEEELQEKKEELLAKISGTVSGETQMPLWVEVEYYANMLDFELHPPCGCKP